MKIGIKRSKSDTKKLFRSLGSCSHTFFHILNREFGNNIRIEERAADPLAGGIYQQGYQCGMLWGASLGVGTEAFRITNDRNLSIGLSIQATQNLMESFSNTTGTTECCEITECNFSSKVSMAKYFFTGKFLSCFDLAENWAPKAIDSAKKILKKNNNQPPKKCMSCATEIARKMGASDEESIAVSGFAGGLGLSGKACGGLAAAIWINNLERCRKNDKTSYKDPNSNETLEKFYAQTDYEIMCEKITGEKFNTLSEHTEFIENGGCNNLINSFSQL